MNLRSSPQTLSHFKTCLWASKGFPSCLFTATEPVACDGFPWSLSDATEAVAIFADTVKRENKKPQSAPISVKTIACLRLTKTISNEKKILFFFLLCMGLVSVQCLVLSASVHSWAWVPGFFSIFLPERRICLESMPETWDPCLGYRRAKWVFAVPLLCLFFPPHGCLPQRSSFWELCWTLELGSDSLVVFSWTTWAEFTRLSSVRVWCILAILSCSWHRQASRSAMLAFSLFGVSPSFWLVRVSRSFRSWRWKSTFEASRRRSVVRL